jgi:hypothetical protein
MRWNVLKTAVCLGTGLILYYIKYGYLAIAYITLGLQFFLIVIKCRTFM